MLLGSKRLLIIFWKCSNIDFKEEIISNLWLSYIKIANSLFYILFYLKKKKINFRYNFLKKLQLKLNFILFFKLGTIIWKKIFILLLKNLILKIRNFFILHTCKDLLILRFQELFKVIKIFFIKNHYFSSTHFLLNLFVTVNFIIICTFNYFKITVLLFWNAKMILL